MVWNGFKSMETPTLYIVNGQGVKPRVESFRLRPKRVSWRFTRTLFCPPITGHVFNAEKAVVKRRSGNKRRLRKETR